MTKQPNQHAIIEQIHAHLRVFVVVQKHGARCFNPPLITNQKKYVQWPDCFFGVPEIEAWDILWDDLRLKLKPSLQHQFPSVERIGIRKLLMLSQKVWQPFNPHLLKQLRLSFLWDGAGQAHPGRLGCHPPAVKLLIPPFFTGTVVSYSPFSQVMFPVVGYPQESQVADPVFLQVMEFLLQSLEEQLATGRE